MDNSPSNADWFKPISDLVASCYTSIAAYRKANRSVHPIWRQVKMTIQSLKTCYARVFSLSCHKLVAYVVEGDVQQPFHLSLVLRLLRSVQVFVGSESSTFLMALAAVEDGRKNGGLFRRIFVLCRSTIFGIVVCIAVARRMLDKFVLPFRAVAAEQRRLFEYSKD